MTFNYLAIILIALSALTLIASADSVNEASGPYKISFDMPAVNNIEVEISDPYPSDTFTWYGLTAKSDDWFINCIITKYNGPGEIDPARIRRGIEASIGGNGVDKKEITQRVVDGRNAIVGIGTGASGTNTEIIYWLDDSNQVDISIFANYNADDKKFKETFDGILDTWKIKY
jgi:hypothetical protein